MLEDKLYLYRVYTSVRECMQAPCRLINAIVVLLKLIIGNWRFYMRLYNLLDKYKSTHS